MPSRFCRRTRNQILRLRVQDPEDLATCHQLAQLDYALASHFEVQRKSDACRSALVACLENSDRILRRRPRDWVALLHRFNAYRMLATVADQEREEWRESRSSRAGRRSLPGVPAPRARPWPDPRTGGMPLVARPVVQPPRRLRKGQVPDSGQPPHARRNPRRRRHAAHRDLAHPGSPGPPPIPRGIIIRAGLPGRTERTLCHGLPLRKPTSWMRRAGRNWWPGV